MKRRTLQLILVLALAASGAGCFGILTGGGGPKASASIRVRNNLEPWATLTIEMRRDGKGVGNLGTVNSGDERTLTFSSGDLEGSYQLAALQPSGATIVSRTFTLFDHAQVQWEIGSNTLSVIQAR